MNRLRLLYLFPEPLPLPKARGIQVINTLNALAAFPIDIRLAFVPVAGAPDPFAAYGLVCPPNVRLLPLSRGLPWPLHSLRMHSGRFFQYRLAAWLRRVAGTPEAPDLVMIRHVKQARRLLDEFPDLPAVYEAHEVFADEASAHKRGRLEDDERSVLQRAAGVIAITRQLAETLAGRYGVARDMAVIPSATALSREVKARDWQNPGRHIIYTGNLYGWKGAEDLVAAARHLPGCRISLVGGEAAAVADLRSRLQPAGAEVEFVGQVPHAEVAGQLARACIAVLPNRAGSVSRYTSPLKLFEYMAAGCAIVASDLPVLREILGEEDAAWFPAGDPEGLAAAIRRLAEDPARAEQLGQRMQEMAGNYTWEARAKRLMDVFAKVRQRSAPAEVNE